MELQVFETKDNGFTLVELIVVVVILSVLVGVTIGGIYSWVGKARTNTDIQNCKQLQDALYANWFQTENIIVDTGEKNNPRNLKSYGRPYYYICLSNIDEKTNYQNLMYNSYVNGGIEGNYGVASEMILGNVKVTKLDFEAIIKYSYRNKTIKTYDDKTKFGENVNSLPAKIQSGNNMFIAIKVDEYGTPNIHVGLVKNGTSVETIASYYWLDTFYAIGYHQPDKIVYNGI